MSTAFKLNAPGSGDPGVRMNPVGGRRTEGLAFSKDLKETTPAKALTGQPPAAPPTELQPGAASELLSAMSSMVQAIAELVKMLKETAPAQSESPAAQPAGSGCRPSGSKSSKARKPARSANSPSMHTGSTCSGNTCPGCSPSGAKGSKLRNITPSSDPVANQKLQQSLDQIRQDPEGAKLLAEAERRGVKIQVGEPGGSNILGVFSPNNNTITVRDPSSIKTLVHELVHATTPEDGNSQTEEGLANVVGDRIASRIQGRAGRDPRSIFNSTLSLYPELGGRNGIRASLANLGIETPNFVA